MMCSNTVFEASAQGQQTCKATALHHRAVAQGDLEMLRAYSGHGALCAHVLRPRFGSFEQFFLEALHEPVRRAFHLSQDDQGRLLSWACCFRYHEREGYAGTVQWVVEIGTTPPERQAADELLSVCIGACRALGLTTLVAMLHSAMSDAINWHAERGFDASGSVDLSGGDHLHVLTRRIR